MLDTTPITTAITRRISTGTTEEALLTAVAYQATYEAAQLFAAIELDLEHAETQDDVISAAGQVLDLFNNKWFKHLIANNEP